MNNAFMDFHTASHERDLVAYRAMGLLRGLVEAGKVPEEHAAEAAAIVEEYRVRTVTVLALSDVASAELENRLVAVESVPNIMTYGPTEPPQRSRQDSDEEPYYDPRDQRDA